MKSESIFRKFISIIRLSNWEVLSENNTWNKIDSINKTIKYEEWKLIFSDGTVLKCADDHILITADNKEVYAEYSKNCKFRNKHGKIVWVDHIYKTGRNIHMYDLSLANNTNHLFYTNGILSHNSTTYCIYLLWYIMFNPEKKVLIAANKKATSLDILGKIQLAYEMLPNWIKPGLLEFNKGKMKFGNLSEIIAEATSSDAARGSSCNILVLDEFGFAEQADKFWASVYPIISSDINGQVIIVSTPNGVGNLFHSLWEKANTGGRENEDGWTPFRVDWWEVPDRDEKWKQQQIATLGSIDKFNQEFGNQFLSSTWKKLIADETITKFRMRNSLLNIKGKELSVNESDPNCKFTYTSYHEFDPRKTYLAAGDASEGTGGDSSVLYVFDITRFNDITMCAKFSQNNISTTEFAYVIFNILGKYYNPYIAIENNAIGVAVLDALCSTVYNYENVISINKHGKPGIQSHMQIKQKACLWIRELFAIDDFNINIYDSKCIDEMDTFIKKDTAQHVVYGAMAKKHDDHLISLIWAMFILNREVLERYYNVVEWVTTSIGKVIPGFIAPLIPYDISEVQYNELIKDKEENKSLNAMFKIEKNIVKPRDRFFYSYDEDSEFGEDEETFHDDAISYFNRIKSVEEYQKELNEHIEERRNFNLRTCIL